ncbi:tRNA 5-methylaminomethyl-2-thiouridine biosynthesis bifunctional protein [Pseudomonas cuatrocienegasensis]|uniref:tRNA 5-methylaminomethyl-2-thiouridine biosynthesis bifunctional protein MnmC n=1 Tax=Pseudomonas cuatrocienegasensis TaxID=543360 RepID=A0ABY1BPQ7_9PSED|nr:MULTISPECIES: bifunctional tRNA (5-methylaminomethyl-2-thiouridine)(34)-methyltransferase MnmD/FAD-dependent 5-carboxymethylaminomethyl-2-thiouridine(34) oxidoreductase MnmC [Pseudomonas]OEC32849.1 bifunctional tRNA (5-methylaminomethyl-2-thiouridylate)-methyltransferase MnmD/FAD-dependent cmnm(5)s(2)U34 oxidoreductase MnmC [Pseudomonas sp. 21C1]SER33286.1 tRNA 5-methylaminomethyl-2-thiouridine biosynthesis bifunctional protein [Pseudomonas cuatrocienegasensis]
MPDTYLAELDWDATGQPLSRHYGDVYFSNENGLDESRYVFLDNNRLGERFAALAAGEQLVIGETGFGTGLNILCAWQLFEQHAPAGARLHVISVEKHPLPLADLRRALALWPELAPYSERLFASYHGIHPGFQQLHLAPGRVSLTLLIGDALALLSQLDARVDAWFLDGFAPAKNPEMWSAELFSELARLSAPGATFGTFSSAGVVRRGLKAVGCTVKRVPGLGKKWEVLRGQFASDNPPPAVPAWYARPTWRAPLREALVIGAGLAGCASAASLAQRGWRVTLLERHHDLAQEASGNPQGVLYLKLSAHGTALSRLIVSGFGYTRRLLERLQAGQDWAPCGVLQLAFDAKEIQRQAILAAAFPPSLLQPLSQTEAETCAGVRLPAGGLFYPEGGWVHPPALCRLLAAHPNISLVTHQEVLGLQKTADGWQAWAGERLLAQAPVVVLAGAAEIKAFAPSAGLPLKRIRGQISRLPTTAQSQALRTVVCAEGYVAPPRDGSHTLGASFDFTSEDLTPNAADHADNLRLLEEISSDLAQRLALPGAADAPFDGRAAFRCTTPDYLPIVGPLADAAAFAEAYAVLRKDARQQPETPCPWLDGLYINSGHGSRGLITAPLSGELIAAWLEGEALPVARDVALACHPNRFMLRQLMRNT